MKATLKARQSVTFTKIGNMVEDEGDGEDWTVRMTVMTRLLVIPSSSSWSARVRRTACSKSAPLWRGLVKMARSRFRGPGRGRVANVVLQRGSTRSPTYYTLRAPLRRNLGV